VSGEGSTKVDGWPASSDFGFGPPAAWPEDPVGGSAWPEPVASTDWLPVEDAAAGGANGSQRVAADITSAWPTIATGRDGPALAKAFDEEDIGLSPFAPKAPAESAFGAAFQAPSISSQTPAVWQTVAEDQQLAASVVGKPLLSAAVAARAEKASRLKKQATAIAAELESFAVEASRQAASADSCMSSLHSSAEALVGQMSDVKLALNSNIRDQVGDEATALTRRRAQLQQQVAAAQRRVEDTAIGGVGAANGATWTAAERERRAALEARVARAEVGRAKAESQAEDVLQSCEMKLMQLRERRRDLEMEISSGCSAEAANLWKSRFESLIAAQNGIADDASSPAAPDHGSARVDQALRAAAAAVQQAVDTAGAQSPPSSLVGAVRCVLGLAEAERRRRALVVEAWQKSQGDDPRAVARGLTCMPPVDRAFSPPRGYDWDLDACKGSGGGTPAPRPEQKWPSRSVDSVQTFMDRNVEQQGGAFNSGFDFGRGKFFPNL